MIPYYTIAALLISYAYMLRKELKACEKSRANWVDLCHTLTAECRDNKELDKASAGVELIRCKDRLEKTENILRLIGEENWNHLTSDTIAQIIKYKKDYME